MFSQGDFSFINELVVAHVRCFRSFHKGSISAALPIARINFSSRQHAIVTRRLCLYLFRELLLSKSHNGINSRPLELYDIHGRMCGRLSRIGLVDSEPAAHQGTITVYSVRRSAYTVTPHGAVTSCDATTARGRRCVSVWNKPSNNYQMFYFLYVMGRCANCQYAFLRCQC